MNNEEYSRFLFILSFKNISFNSCHFHKQMYKSILFLNNRLKPLSKFCIEMRVQNKVLLSRLLKKKKMSGEKHGKFAHSIHGKKDLLKRSAHGTCKYSTMSPSRAKEKLPHLLSLPWNSFGKLVSESSLNKVRIFNFTSNNELKLWRALSSHPWRLTAVIIPSILQYALQHPKLAWWRTCYWTLLPKRRQNSH